MVGGDEGMKDKISAYMDGELERHAEGTVYEALARDGAELETWRAYHLISDAMRDTRVLSSGFVARVSADLAKEPTVFAPGALPQRREPMRWMAMSAAAGVAAVAVVGWLTFNAQPTVAPQVPLVAQAPKALPAPQPAPAPASAQPVLVPPPSEADDYLLAHHSHSPRGPIMPYVRNVAAPVSRP